MTGKLIALGGPQRAGKDATGDYLEEKHGFVKMGMSDPLNEALLKMNPWIKPDFSVRIGYHYVKPWEFVKYRDLHDAVGYVEAKRHHEVREHLQILGTQVGRDMFGQDVWVDIAVERINYLRENGKDVVITAIRFPNEIEMVKRLGGVSVWIERSEELRGVDKNVEQHESDKSLTIEDFSIVIDNNGDLDQLHTSIERLLNILPQVPAGSLTASRHSVGNIPLEQLAFSAPYDR